MLGGIAFQLCKASSQNPLFYSVFIHTCTPTSRYRDLFALRHRVLCEIYARCTIHNELRLEDLGEEVGPAAQLWKARSPHEEP